MDLYYGLGAVVLGVITVVALMIYLIKRSYQAEAPYEEPEETPIVAIPDPSISSYMSPSERAEIYRQNGTYERPRYKPAPTYTADDVFNPMMIGTIVTLNNDDSIVRQTTYEPCAPSDHTSVAEHSYTPSVWEAPSVSCQDSSPSADPSSC